MSYYGLAFLFYFTRYHRRIDKQLDSAATNSRETDSKTALTKPRAMETRSINTNSTHTIYPSLKAHQIIINNVIIELTKGRIESEGAKVSERTGIIKLYVSM